MLPWRIGVFGLLFLLTGLPVLFLFGRLFESMPGAVQLADSARLVRVTWNTFLLTTGTVVLAVPAGTLLAAAIYRTDLPLRAVFLFLVVLALFIPVPVMTSSWQAVFGGRDWLPVVLWPPRPGQPWTEGVLPAVWVHALASVPWVVVLTGHGLCRVETELEEEALLFAGPLRVVGRFTLVRGLPAICFAALWVAILTAGEISVSDMFLIRTAAEEVYLALNEGGPGDVAWAILLSVPATAALWIAVISLGPKLLRALPSVDGPSRPLRDFKLRRSKWPCFLLVAAAMFLIVGVPLFSMAWRAGFQSESVGWSPAYFATGIERAITLNGFVVLASLVTAAAAGFLTAALALVLSWLISADGRGGTWLRIAVFCWLGLLWVLPGPVAGIGLASLIFWLHQLGLPWLSDALYRGPSNVPLVWADVLRCLPFAMAVLWPAVRSLPREQADAARTDGAGPGRVFTKVYVPLCLISFLTTAVVVMSLSLAEVAASKIVATPGPTTFTLALFDRMHYGVSQDVGALCLLLLALILLGAVEAAARHVALRSSLRQRQTRSEAGTPVLPPVRSAPPLR